MYEKQDQEQCEQVQRTESLELVREIITRPEEGWRSLPGEQEEEEEQEEERPCTTALSDMSNFSCTTKPHLIQQAAEGDLLSLFKVTSASSCFVSSNGDFLRPSTHMCELWSLHLKYPGPDNLRCFY